MKPGRGRGWLAVAVLAAAMGSGLAGGLFEGVADRAAALVAGRELAEVFGAGPGLAAVMAASRPVDANTASREELEAIRGIGPAMSARIIEARRRKPFADLDDLKSRVRGIGDKTLKRMTAAGLTVGAVPPAAAGARGRTIEGGTARRAAAAKGAGETQRRGQVIELPAGRAAAAAQSPGRVPAQAGGGGASKPPNRSSAPAR